MPPSCSASIRAGLPLHEPSQGRWSASRRPDWRDSPRARSSTVDRGAAAGQHGIRDRHRWQCRLCFTLGSGPDASDFDGRARLLGGVEGLACFNGGRCATVNCPPYNILVTRRWMTVVVPRVRETCDLGGERLQVTRAGLQEAPLPCVPNSFPDRTGGPDAAAGIRLPEPFRRRTRASYADTGLATPPSTAASTGLPRRGKA
jgi:hypothetical protein